jgi:hypothetical protein
LSVNVRSLAGAASGRWTFSHGFRSILRLRCSQPKKDEKRAVPYGVYDINNNTGWVSVGTDHDTAAFAVNAIRRWWKAMGKKR